MSLKPLVEHLIKSLVEEQDAVRVEESTDRGAVVYGVTVAPNDFGRVIGKEGRVISCVRHVVGAAGAKIQKKTFVRVLNPD